jgi:large subunit ribosomal protein L18
MTDVRVTMRIKLERLQRRKQHGLKKLFGTSERPRLIVYRSNRHIFAQLVDDSTRTTITGCSTLSPAIHDQVAALKGKLEEAKLVGKQIAVLAKEKGIAMVAFDRNGRRYHGRVKALADGAREAGLQF